VLGTQKLEVCELGLQSKVSDICKYKSDLLSMKAIADPQLWVRNLVILIVIEE
jgi:hypothetical protein